MDATPYARSDFAPPCTASRRQSYATRGVTKAMSPRCPRDV